MAYPPDPVKIVVPPPPPQGTTGRGPRRRLPKIAMPVALALALAVLLACGIGLASLPWGSWLHSGPKTQSYCVNIGSGMQCITVTVQTITHS